VIGSPPQPVPARTERTTRSAQPADLSRADLNATKAEVPVAAAPGPGIAVPALHDGVAADRWAELVQRMVQAGTIVAMVRELAMQAECTAIVVGGAEAMEWRLRVERENLRAPALRDRLQAAMADALQARVRLEIEAGAAVDTPAERALEERRRRQAEAEQVIHDDPLVKALLAQYKTARIVPGSVKPL